jgi:uncharacterized protein (TIGR00255 family)
MIHSMTGFGKVNGIYNNKKVSIEIRSLNSKGLDLTIKLPNSYKELENEIRRIASEKISRGKVDIGVYIESDSVESNATINTEIAKRYISELKTLNEETGGKEVDFLSIVMKLPDVVIQQSKELEDVEKLWLIDLVHEATNQLSHFRAIEGQALYKDLVSRIEEIRLLLEEVKHYETERLQTVRDRILKGFNELKNIQIDENRLEQEMIFYMEKLDISEEKTRLANHLDYFLTSMNELSTGKKLGFIAQEIGREINTLGSKSNHAEMQKCVVNMKDSLEKIKEQLLNIL